jgi:hypothetical protein
VIADDVVTSTGVGAVGDAAGCGLAADVTSSFAWDFPQAVASAATSTNTPKLGAKGVRKFLFSWFEVCSRISFFLFIFLGRATDLM